jgi:hypothetical protein
MGSRCTLASRIPGPRHPVRSHLRTVVVRRRRSTTTSIHDLPRGPAHRARAYPGRSVFRASTPTRPGSSSARGSRSLSRSGGLPHWRDDDAEGTTTHIPPSFVPGSNAILAANMTFVCEPMLIGKGIRHGLCRGPARGDGDRLRAAVRGARAVLGLRARALSCQASDGGRPDAWRPAQPRAARSRGEKKGKSGVWHSSG